MTITLCQACQRALRTILNSQEQVGAFSTINLHKNFASLRESILSHCVLCNYLWRWFWSIYDEDSRLSFEAETFAGGVDFPRVTVKLEFKDTPFTLPKEYRLELHPPTFEESFVRRLKAKCERPPLTLHLEVLSGNKTPPRGERSLRDPLEQIRQWISTCKWDHLECREASRASSRGWMPTRLVDLGNPDTPKIITSNQAIPNLPYATLSHCWGGCQPIRLLEKRDHTMIDSRGKILAKLPKTYADTFAICRSLGIRYLWVDSLCIKQDSTADWHSEAQKMDRVYENAAINISALGACDSTEGLFLERTSDGHPPWQIFLDADEANTGLCCNIYMEELCLWFDFEGEPLNQRAWVAQERLLSRKIVHFGKRRLYWECLHGMTHEYAFGPFVDRFRIQSWGPDFKRFINKTAATPRNKDDSDGSEQTPRVDDNHHHKNVLLPHGLTHFWSEMVRDYSRRNLTKPGDKLIAIRGVVNRIQRFLPEHHQNYIFGLWRADLLAQLMWYASKDGGLTVAEKYRAPSWSWAAYDGEIFYSAWSRDELKALVKVKECWGGEGDRDGQIVRDATKPFICLCGCLITEKEARGAYSNFRAFPDTGLAAGSEHESKHVYLPLLEVCKLRMALGLILQAEDQDAGIERFVRKGGFLMQDRIEEAKCLWEQKDERLIVII